MRRADRLFQIIQLLRRKRGSTTAAFLAQKLEISERTIYRDIADLVAGGTPIDGEAGVGYRLGADYDLPPLMFDRDEIQALVLGARVVQQFGGPVLARAASRALTKVAAALPKDLQAVLNNTTLFVPGGAASQPAPPSDTLSLIREALLSQRKLTFAYRDKDDRRSDRVVRPLGAFFWGRSWTLAAFCEARVDFRNFRIDRIEGCALSDDTFAEEAGRTLADMLARYGPEAVKLLAG